MWTTVDSVCRSWRHVTTYKLTDVINKNTTDLAVRCSTESVEFGWVELSCVAKNTPLLEWEGMGVRIAFPRWPLFLSMCEMYHIATCCSVFYVFCLLAADRTNRDGSRLVSAAVQGRSLVRRVRNELHSRFHHHHHLLRRRHPIACYLWSRRQSPCRFPRPCRRKPHYFLLLVLW